jgi:selenocysteine-specific elongation factor
LFHAGTAQSLATVTLLDTNELQPGGSSLAQLHLDAPFVLLPGDRFILRGFALQRHHGTTLGGGVVLRTLGARTRRGTPELLQVLRANEKATGDERLLLEVERAGTAGVTRAALQMRLGRRLGDASFANLLGKRQIVRYDKERGAVIAAGALDELQRSAVEQVEAFHAAQPLAEGMPREELRAKLTDDPKLLHVVLEALKGKLIVERDYVKLPTHDTKKTSTGLQPLAERVAKLFAEAQLAPPRPAEAAVALGAEIKELERVIDLLARGGTLLKIKDLVFHKDAVDGLRRKLTAFLVEKTQITPQEWKELVGQTRKFAIPLAEHFDAEKLTLRIGDLRKLRSKPVV